MFAGLAVHLLVGFISQKLRKFPIIQRTPLLQRTLNYKQPADYIMDIMDMKGKVCVLLLFVSYHSLGTPDMEVAIRTREELATLLDEFLGAQLHDLCYSFSMDKTTTAKQFKAFLSTIIESTRQIHPSSSVRITLKVL